MPIQKILVVDDSKTELHHLSDMLGKRGYACAPPRTAKRRCAAWPRTSPT
jgi:twitching motility two-component system response regulator PilH